MAHGAWRGFTGAGAIDGARTYFARCVEAQIDERTLAVAWRHTDPCNIDLYASAFLRDLKHLYPDLAARIDMNRVKAIISGDAPKWRTIAEVLRDAGLPWVEPESIERKARRQR